jgi:hypothetical protein
MRLDDCCALDWMRTSVLAHAVPRAANFGGSIVLFAAHAQRPPVRGWRLYERLNVRLRGRSGSVLSWGGE